MTTRPFLFIDLQKSWREDLHPRDTFGKFSTIKGGSRVVTKQGKTGVVDKVTDSHYHITTEEGKKAKVKKDDAIHANDHKKVMDAQKKAAKKKKAAAKKAGVKQSATKAQKKADGTHKKATPIEDPTAGKKSAKKAPVKPVKATKKPSKPKKVSRKAEALAAPVLKRAASQSEEPTREIKQNTALAPEQQKVNKERNTATNAAQEQAKQDLANGNVDQKAQGSLSADWTKPAVQKLLSLPKEKRNMEQIQKVARALTRRNIDLAHAIGNKQAKAWGQHPQYNLIGNVTTKDPKRTEAGHYADVMQSARGSMYETLLSVLSGSQNPGSDITPHVINRMKDKINNDLYGMMNQVAAPHEVRPAIRAMHAGKAELEQKLGREATHEELASHLAATSKHFNEAPIAPRLEWDEKNNTWNAPKHKVTDPSERLSLLRQYDNVQHTASADAHVGDEGEKDVTIGENAVDEGRSPEEAYEKKERQKELEGALPDAMRAMKMRPESIKVWTLTHSEPSAKRNQPFLTGDEVAEKINAEGGWEGKPVSRSWVAKWYAEGAKALQEAHKQNHPALAQLRLFKSFVMTQMLRSVYEMNLVKSLHSWGFDTSILREKFLRVESGKTMFDIRKSLDVTEYVGAYVRLDNGYVVARIVTHDIPRGEELVKAFGDFEELQKALFSHKEGGNNAVNQKAAEYVKANAGKYKAAAKDQQDRINGKKGELTWSERLQKEKGGVWITWGGKRILINADSGEILFDSKNEAHRDEAAENYGVTNQEDKMDFHHEADEAEANKNALMEQAGKDHAEGKYGTGIQKWADKYGVKTKTVKDEKGKKSTVLDTDEDGSLQFDHSKHNLVTDHGAKAFEDSLGDLKDHIKSHKASAIDEHHHKVIGMYSKLSDEEKDAYDRMSPDEKEQFVGNKIAEHEGVKDMMSRAAQMAKEGKKGKDIHAALKDELDQLGKDTDSMALRNKDKMTTVFNQLGGKNPLSEEEAVKKLGAQELSRAREEANKRIVPEGHYEIGNKANGKSMVVKIGHRIDPTNGNFTSYVQEAFNPKTGEHFSTNESDDSWGQLGKALGLKNNSAEKFIYESNDPSKGDAVMQAMDEDEAKELRKNTSLGLQDSMLHKNFQMVDQKRDKNGGIVSTTYAQDMPDGTQNAIEVGKDGFIKDPVMARFVQNEKPIHSAEDLSNALKGAVGRKIWVTAHAGPDVHIGDALGHHLQLMYDGKGAPRVVGGKYDGYRYMDSKDLPKGGATDEHTGEPIKTLFKNGKLVDRGQTVNNDVPVERGNAVMYPDGDKWHKGKVRDIQDGNYQVTDSKGNLVGMFRKNELQPAKEKGRTLSDSGQAVLKTKQNGVHRLNTDQAFKMPHNKASLKRKELSENAQTAKAKRLLAEAFKKAKINGAVDREGNLNAKLELNDGEMNRLKQALGRSKAAKALLKQFNSNHTTALELHVPEALRKDVEAEGVSVGKDGKAEVSAAKFEQLRGILGGVSMDNKAQDFLAPHFRMKDRTPREVEELKKDYQPSMAQGVHAEEYRKQFKQGSFLLDPKQGLYGTQLEGISHLVERGRALAGHGMGTGKTILGVMAAMHHKATQTALKRPVGKTLVVAPKGIMSDWGKEIATHTNSKALYIGSGFKSDKKAENGRKLWGQDGTEHEAVGFNEFKKNGSMANEDHDFHIVSYDTFMKNRDHFAGSGLYDNIAIDEVHAFKNAQGQRGKALSETTNKFKNVWGLSGTPMENDAREMHSLIDTITGGRHGLGNQKEFVDNFMQKDRKGKIIGIKPGDPARKLGDELANIVQFRSGEDVTYNDGSKIHFPHLSGAPTTENNENPKDDFVGDLTDRSRDHQTTDYYGTKHSIVDYEAKDQKVNPGTEDEYNVTTMEPKGVKPGSPMGKMYDTYRGLQEKYLPESKLKELSQAVRTGIDNTGKKGGQNYLTAMQKLQKYLNAPLAHKMYVPGGGNAIESDETNAQSEAPSDKKGDPIPHEVDEYGNKRYYESDGQGGYKKDASGNPVLLPPLHKENPKADYLKKRISTYLDGVAQENTRRRANGQVEIMPKVVVKSGYTTFGTDIVDGVLRELQNEHPELQRWRDKTGDKFGAGRFTGDADDREDTKVGFRGNKKDYANNQGHLWATTVSPAGKEGVDFGNAHYMIHYDQDWNPQKMAQFTARVRRSDSAKTHAQVGRANSVRVESLHMPGTMEDFMFDAQDKKMNTIKEITEATRNKEKSKKYGDTHGTLDYGHKAFTRGKKNRAGAKPKKTISLTDVKKPTGGSSAVRDRKAVAAAEKSLKLVVLL